MKLFHDSRSLEYRAPFGAVRCGEALCLRLRCEDGVPARVSLLLRLETGPLLLPMRPIEGGLYEARFRAPGDPGLVWYYFMAQDADGETVYYGDADDGLGGVGAQRAAEPPPYQITVYARDFLPPAWLREGILYQIFPDRFCRRPDTPPVREGMHIHADWEETPWAPYDPRNTGHADDFFGGTLRGILEKLDYLASLHVTVLYLNPIFQARSNHRYDTGDYLRVDPMLGSEEDLRALCREAEKRGMHVLLDGVFSHTGDDSLYFNRYGTYPSLGAYQSPDSPYAGWFTFKHFPDKYRCWWNVLSLPEVNKDNESYRAFILGENGVARHWLRAGAAGWRLDVADELPMRFLRDLRQSVHAEAPGSVLLGEVWEDASRKVSYGQLRCYCLGDTVDSVMNYPLREAALAFVSGQIDAAAFVRRVESLRENYPAPFFYSLMNLMGSHDRPRLLNALCGETWESVPPLHRGEHRLSDAQRRLAVRRLREMWRLYIAMPGMPSLYYGDEAGLEGASDPFCRGTFPWGKEDQEILALTREALALRASRPVLQRGAFAIEAVAPDCVRIRRFAHAGFDIFGQPLDDEPCQIEIHAVPTP